MALEQNFCVIAKNDLLDLAREKKQSGYRFIQILCAMSDDDVDVLYSFMKDGVVENFTIEKVKADETIPSITEYYLAAFPFENEAHDLFGVKIENIAIDFEGDFYMVAMDKPMTVISPEQKAAREKAAKIAAAKAAKAAKAKAAADASAAAPVQENTSEKVGE